MGVVMNEYWMGVVSERMTVFAASAVYYNSFVRAMVHGSKSKVY